MNNKVWHNGLFVKRKQLNLPPCYIKWIGNFLNDRNTRVDLETITGTEDV